VKIKFKGNKIRLKVVKKGNQSIISNCEKEMEGNKNFFELSIEKRKNIMI
jgi:hypothetical protein